MTRARTQMLLLALYGASGVLAWLAPGTTGEILAIDDVERTSAALFVIRVLGAASLLIALLLFFFIANEPAGRRLMLTLALYEVLVILAGGLSYGADDLEARTLLLTIASSGVLALLSAWGGFFAGRVGGKTAEAG